MNSDQTRYRIVPLKNLTYRIVAVDGDAPPVTVTHAKADKLTVTAAAQPDGKLRIISSS